MRCCGSRVCDAAIGSGLSYLAETGKQAIPTALQAPWAAALLSNGPTCSRVMAPTGM